MAETGYAGVSFDGDSTRRVDADDRSAPLTNYADVRFDESSDDPRPRTVRRFDLSELQRPTKTPEGFLRAQGHITRSGVFDYLREDGTVQRELRPPEEVFDPESMRSFDLVPVTLGHPPDNLTPETVREHQVGSVGRLERAGEYLRADLMITAPHAISAIENGRNQLSNGYTMRLVQRSGSYKAPDGSEHRFDCVQTKIRGNHTAIVTKARAGDGAFIRTDSGDMVLPETAADAKTKLKAKAKSKATQEDNADGEKGKKMDEVEIEISGQKITVPKAVAERMDALEKQAKQPPLPLGETTGLSKVQAELEKAQGKIAALEAGAAQRQDTRPSDAKATTERLIMLSRASAILDKPIDELVRMDDGALMREVVKAAAPQVSIEGKSDDFVRGIFDTVSSQKRVDTAAAMARFVGGSKDYDEEHRDDGGLQKRSDEAKHAMRDRMRNAWDPAWRKKHDPEYRGRTD